MDKKTAKKIVNAIIGDLSDRRGLSHVWYDIDQDIQKEIKRTWVDIVRKHAAEVSKVDEDA